MTEPDEISDPLKYLYGTMDAETALKELGFHLEGMNTSEKENPRGVWHKNMGHGIRMIVVTDERTPSQVNLFKVRMRLGSSLGANWDELERAQGISINTLRHRLMGRSEALEDEPDISDPLKYAHSTVDPKIVLQDLGFKLEGMTQDSRMWIKKDRGIWHLVIAPVNWEHPDVNVIYKQLRVGKGSLTPTETLLLKHDISLNQVRRYVMQWHTEALQVIEHLLDSDPDAFDPRADLDHLLDRCPKCGSSNISEAEDEKLADCFNCGVWFDPLQEDDEPPTREEYFKQVSDVTRELERRDLPPSHRKQAVAREKALRKFRRKFEKPVQENEEDEIKDIKGYVMQHGIKPYGYVLRSRMKDSPYPWMNRRWSDRPHCCGNFRHYIGDATVFKRSPKGYDLDVVPVYSDPRKTADWALDPAYFRESLDDDIINYKAYAMQHGLTPHITTTYSQTTPESVEQGDFSDSGWIDEKGEDIEIDELDKEDGITLADKAADWLRDQGASATSSSGFHPGIWYSTEWSTIDYRTGVQEERNFHLNGFTPEQEREVWEKFHTPRRRH